MGAARKETLSLSGMAPEQTQTSGDLKDTPSLGSQERTAELVAGLDRLMFYWIRGFEERQSRGRDQHCPPAPRCHAEWTLEVSVPPRHPTSFRVGLLRVPLCSQR